MSSYKDQVEEFKKDNSLFEEYPETITKKEHALLRFFEYNPNKGKDVTQEQKKFREKLIVPGEKKGAKATTAAAILGVEVTNIAKVIKVGPGSSFKAGDVVTVGHEKVKGYHDNEALKIFMKSVNAQGASPIPPEDMRPKIPNLERHLVRYMYKSAATNEVTAKDRLTYLLPDLEILSKL